jgi:hypothetical protein
LVDKRVRAECLGPANLAEKTKKVNCFLEPTPSRQKKCRSVVIEAKEKGQTRFESGLCFGYHSRLD